MQRPVPLSKHIGIVSHLAIYPVKGCARMELDSASVVTSGFEGDREYMIVREEAGPDGVHEFITQRHKRTRRTESHRVLQYLRLSGRTLQGAH